MIKLVSHSLSLFIHLSSVSDTILINNCDEQVAKSAAAAAAAAADDDSNHNTENGEIKVITEIDTKEDNANDVVVDKEENQNSLDTNDDDNHVMIVAVRDVIHELKEMYNEFLLQIKLVQKDLIRSAKYEELESKVIYFI